MATQREVLRVWAMLLAAYPAFVKDGDPAQLEQTLHVYQQLLADVPGDVLNATAMQHIASNKWFPTVAELRAGAIAITATQYVPAMEAWGELVDAMLDYGSYAPMPQFSNPILAAVVRQMGWKELCQSENPVADRAHFCQAYEARVRRAQDDALTLPQVRELHERLTAPQSLPARIGGVIGALADHMTSH